MLPRVLPRPQFRDVTRTRGVISVRIQYTPYLAYLVCSTATAETLVKIKAGFVL